LRGETGGRRDSILSQLMTREKKSKWKGAKFKKNERSASEREKRGKKMATFLRGALEERETGVGKRRAFIE